MNVNLNQLRVGMSPYEIIESDALPWTLRHALCHQTHEHHPAVVAWHGDPSSEEKFFDALKASGYRHPEVFMDLDNQVRCPISGIDLLSDDECLWGYTNNQFKYSRDYMITHSGAAVRRSAFVRVVVTQDNDINNLFNDNNDVFNEDDDYNSNNYNYLTTSLTIAFVIIIIIIFIFIILSGVSVFYLIFYGDSPGDSWCI